MSECVYCGLETGDEHDEHEACTERAALEGLELEEAERALESFRPADRATVHPA